MDIFIAGDTHGNIDWLRDYLYPAAYLAHAHTIVQVGDFGYWEHEQVGVAFLDEVAELAQVYGIDLYWLRGNHDKSSLCERRYRRHFRDEGFLQVRPGLYYIPDGLIFTWAGVRMRAFGGAYSLDKFYRLQQERLRHQQNQRIVAGLRGHGLIAEVPAYSAAGTLWFPEEEMTDADMTGYLAADSAPVQVIFSHDKPRAADPGVELSPQPLCLPNQDRLQRALWAHQPRWWLHGHLHVAYRDQVRCGDFRHTTVVGLAADDKAHTEHPWRPADTWCVLHANNGVAQVARGRSYGITAGMLAAVRDAHEM